MKMVTEILTEEELKIIDKMKGEDIFNQIDYYLSKHWDQYGIGLYIELRKIMLLRDIRFQLSQPNSAKEENWYS